MNSNKHHLRVSYENDIRKITVNSQTRLCEFVKRALNIFDLNINNIAGIFFFFIDANVYLGDCEENDFNKTIQDFLDEYDENINRIFIIDPINTTSRETSQINDFLQKYQLFNQSNAQNYYFRPTYHITNHYNMNNPPEQNDYNYDYSNNFTYPRYNSRQLDRMYDFYSNIFRSPPYTTNASATREASSRNNSASNNNQERNQRSDSPGIDITIDLNTTQINRNQQNDNTTQQNENSNQNRNPQNRNPQNQNQNANWGSRSSAFQTPLSILQAMSTAFQPGQTYVSTGLGGYANILESLNNILGSEYNVLTPQQIANLNHGEYQTLMDSGLILPDCNQCNITLEELTATTQVIALPCKHAFKEQAITYWLTNNSNRCPICRAPAVRN